MMRSRSALAAVALVRHWEAVLLAVGLLLIALTFRDYGITTDEGVQSEYGELTLAYFRSGFQDRRCNDLLDLRLYGPLFEAGAALIYQSWPESKFAIRHFASALAGLLTIPAVIRFGRLLQEPERDGDRESAERKARLRLIPLFAALGLAGQPQFYGHIFNNSKDIPLACAFAWAIWAIARLFANRDYRWRTAMTAAALMGLAFASRPASYAILGAALLAAHLLAELQEQAKPIEDRRSLSGLKIAAIFGAAWLMMVVPWPWSHSNPIVHPAQAMGMAARFHTPYPVLFGGEVLWSDRLPRWYLAQTFVMTAPPLLLAIAAVGLGTMIGWQVRDWRSRRASLAFLLQLWLLGPLILWTATRSNIYDGVRHFLFVMPALALWFAIGADTIVRRFRTLTAQCAASAFVAVAALAAIPDMIRLHPYQMTYHNLFAGGTRGADGRFELDYWCSSYKEGMEWINRQPPARPDGTTRVLVSASSFSRIGAEAFAAPHVRVRSARENLAGGVPPEFDYYLAAARTGVEIRSVGPTPFTIPVPYRPSQSCPDSPIVHRVGREGATFAVIRKR